MAEAMKRSWAIPVICVVFILVNALLMANRAYWFNLVPVALIIGWAMVASVDRLLIFLAFATPLSVNLEELDLGGIGISLPTEPIMVGLTVLFLVKLALEKGLIEQRVWRHPITVIILAQLVWMAFCILPSSMPIVSLKYVLARTWFLTTMYFMVSRLFQDPRNIQRFLWAYVSGLVIVVIYTVVRHAQHGFEHDPAHWVMSPFFKDHTSYGAILAFFLPFAVGAVSFPGYSRSSKALSAVVLVILTVGLIFSYTRAAWASCIGAFGVFFVTRLRIPAWALLLTLVAAGGVALVEKEQITIYLERNRDESSDDLAQHVSSIGNISSDASNLERINRWNSALRMFQERPWTGWGPGTYVFQYAPFQAAEDRTIISTNFGLIGNAHSEFLGPLAEQGVLGLLLVVSLIVVTCWTAIRLRSRMPPGVDQYLVGVAFFGLVTYYVHAIINNFLDLDKASVPFWAFTALIVVMDLKYPAAPKGVVASP